MEDTVSDVFELKSLCGFYVYFLLCDEWCTIPAC
jgi:hypothetical protein